VKVNPTPPTEAINQVIANTRISTTPSGTTAAATPVNNYNSKSQAYQQMNALVIRLDQQFKALPP
jgi:hypothetical protein